MPDRKAIRLLLFILCVLSVFLISCSREKKTEPVEQGTELQQPTVAPEEEFRKPGEDLLVTGKVIKENGEPLAASSIIFLFAGSEWDEVKTNDEGVVMNPTSRTDENGKFTVRITEEHLKVNNKYAIRISVGGWYSRVTDEIGAEANYTFNIKARKFDMGTITVRGKN